LRDRVYGLVEIVSWPAAAWGGIELLLRAETGYAAGATDTALITACAILTICFARTRRRMLTPIG
jgi:hypothetical protein